MTTTKQLIKAVKELEDGLYTKKYYVKKEAIDELYEIYSDIQVYIYNPDETVISVLAKETWDELKEDIEDTIYKVIIEKYDNNALNIRMFEYGE